MTVSSRTRVFAILGDPVGQSLSPRMQTAGFQAAGLDAVFVSLQPAADSVVAQMATLVRSGGGGNITIPFKELAAQAPAKRDARVELLSTTNVFGGAAGELHVGNTDVDGILAGLDELQGPEGGWCVIGTGGSARAVIGAAAERGTGVAVRSRAPARAQSFQQWAAAIGVRAAEWDRCRVVINATPLGLSPDDPFPVDPADLAADTVVLDLVYGQNAPTRWVQACQARGLRAIDGRTALLAQGAASWRVWFPGVAPPVEVMRAALDGRLG